MTYWRGQKSKNLRIIHWKTTNRQSCRAAFYCEKITLRNQQESSKCNRTGGLIPAQCQCPAAWVSSVWPMRSDTLSRHGTFWKVHLHKHCSVMVMYSVTNETLIKMIKTLLTYSKENILSQRVCWEAKWTHKDKNT